MLSQLEDDPQRFGIKTVSVGMTTLEEVYLRVEVERITAESEHDKEWKVSMRGRERTRNVVTWYCCESGSK